MSIKRDLLGRIFPNGIPFTAAVNNNAVFVRMRRERISSCPEPANRMELYRQLASHIGNGPIDYLEFGVFEGASIGADQQIVMRRPRLAVALLQILVQRTIDFTHRIESFSVDNIARRLARSLIRFSERLGSPEEDGSVRMVPFTHELLAQYVGTSREIVTVNMNQFRRQGYVKYSRKGIIVHREAFREWLRQNAAASRQSTAVSSSAS